MRVRVTRATWVPQHENRSMPYDIQVDDVDIDGESLWVAVATTEGARQAGAAYSSHPQHHRNGEVWVPWERETQDPPFASLGYDRYQLLTPRGVQLGGCSEHEHWECWSQDHFPPPVNGAQPVHVLVGRLGRLMAHRDCPWTWWSGAKKVFDWHDDGSVAIGLDRCCEKPSALTRREQDLVGLVCEQIRNAFAPYPSNLWNLDLLLGWRLHGVYDEATVWPGYDPLWDLGPELRTVWLADLALREMDP